MNVLSLFSGIGAFEKALTNLGINYNLIGFSEIDKYAIKSYCAIHNVEEEKNLGDISKIDISMISDNIDLITHGSPCQDFSVAGKQAGAEKGSGTRSSLMWYTVEIVEKTKPKFVIWENVKNLLSKRHRHNFDNYIEIMEKLGYNSYFEVLNAKNYGIPQNRERVYTISIRKDIDNNKFKFPEKEKLNKRLKDVLEKDVEDKYYLSSKMINGFLKHNEKHIVKGTGFVWKPKNQEEIENTIRANTALCPTDNTINVGEVTPNSQAGQVYSSSGISPTIIAGTHGYAIGNILEDNQIKVVGELDIKGHDSVKRVYSQEGLSPTLTNMQGGNRQPKVLIKNATKKGYDEAVDGDSVNLAYPNSRTRRGRVGHQIAQTLTAADNMAVLETPYIVASRGRNPENPNSRVMGEYLEQRLEANTNGTTNCISTVQKDNYVVEENIKIRKLTPLECWRLMGFTDKDFEKAKETGNSNTQLYKQAGNSIVVNVLEKIFKNLLLEE